MYIWLDILMFCVSSIPTDPVGPMGPGLKPAIGRSDAQPDGLKPTNICVQVPKTLADVFLEVHIYTYIYMVLLFFATRKSRLLRGFLDGPMHS